jgi:hypothetical protein
MRLFRSKQLRLENSAEDKVTPRTGQIEHGKHRVVVAGPALEFTWEMQGNAE